MERTDYGVGKRKREKETAETREEQVFIVREMVVSKKSAEFFDVAVVFCREVGATRVICLRRLVNEAGRRKSTEY